MITKEEVINMYLFSKREAEKLLELMKEEDADNPAYQETLELIQIQIKMIDLFIEAINQDEPTQEELQHHFNRALSWRIDSN